jgi:hypothetical protein
LLEAVAANDEKLEERLAIESAIGRCHRTAEVLHLKVFDGWTFQRSPISSGSRSTQWRAGTVTPSKNCADSLERRGLEQWTNSKNG